MDNSGFYTCMCVVGYSGLRCQTDVNECASTPCANGGTCGDGINRFTCVCVAGYSGLLCSTNINECASVPCANGGTCTDLLASYSCTCGVGFSGMPSIYHHHPSVFSPLHPPTHIPDISTTLPSPSSHPPSQTLLTHRWCGWGVVSIHKNRNPMPDKHQ